MLLPLALPLLIAAGPVAPPPIGVPGPHIRTAPLQAAPPRPLAGPEVPPQRAGQPETLFINFDGAVLRRGCGNDARHDCSSLADLFDGYVGPFIGDAGRRASIIQAVRKDLEDFGVRAVTRRPEGDDAEYTMVLYGDLGEQEFAGIAPYVDCGNLWANDTCFAGAFQGSNIGATIILQEAAHTWGLEHVDSEFDNLHPFVAQATPYFQDRCNKIVGDTDLVEVSGICNSVHEQFCEAGYQNSYQELRTLFGPAVPDTSAPTLTITSPEDGSYHVLPVTIPMRGEMVDDLDPQFYAILVTSDGDKLYEGEGLRLELLLKNPPAGDYDLLVTAVDGGGNKAEDRVRFTVLAEGSDDPDTDSAGTDTDVSTDTDTSTGGPDADGGGCRTHGAHGPTPGLALLALLLVARRRR